MTTIFTKAGIISYVQHEGMSIPADDKNRDYRKIMIQDGLTPFPRIEIVEPEPEPARDLAAEIDAIKPILDEILLGGL